MDENSNRYRRLKRALFGDSTGKIRTFAIISPENPDGKQLTPSENKARLSTFKTGLKMGHFVYVPLKGSYGVRENSFIIFNCTLSDAMILASDYGQQSFFYGNTNEDTTSIIRYYKSDNGGQTYKHIDTSDVITYEDEATDFFSKFGLKFRINMQEFGDDVPKIEDEGEFLESLNDDRTFLSRAMYRKNSYKKN